MSDDKSLGYNQFVIISLILLAVGISSFYVGFFLSNSSTELTNLPELLISPGVENDFVYLIRSANYSLDLQVYAFTNKKLAKALIDSQKRGVRVRVLIEEKTTKSSSTQSILSMLLDDGVEVMFSSPQFRSTHSKFLIIDGVIAIVGSHNWSNSAMNRNREVSVILKTQEILSELRELFENDWHKASEIEIF